VVTATANGSINAAPGATIAKCPTGTYALGGGVSDSLNSNPHIETSVPANTAANGEWTSGKPGGWYGQETDNNTTITVYVICSN
jgi:hypothetical protein